MTVRPPRHLTGKRPEGETPEHWRAKVEAFCWLWRRGYRKIAFEMRIGPHVIDVVAWSDVEVAVVECKGHRADWLRDLGLDDRAAAAVIEINESPNPSRFEWQEMREAEDQTEYEEHKAIRRRVNRLRKKAYQWGWEDGEKRLRQSKFHDAGLTARTTERYVCAPDGVVLDGELPEGWGQLQDVAVLHRSKGKGALENRTALFLNSAQSKRSTWHTITSLPVRYNEGRPEPLDELG